MKTLRMLPDQIPNYWEQIKQVICEKLGKQYANEFLYRLLSSKSHCFITFDNGGNVAGLTIVTIYMQKLSNEKELLIDCWTPPNIWDTIQKFASAIGCKRVCVHATNDLERNELLDAGYSMDFTAYSKEIF